MVCGTGFCAAAATANSVTRSGILIQLLIESSGVGIIPAKSPSALLTADDSQVSLPRADFVRVLPRQHSRDLHNVIEVVRDPRGEELAQCHRAELRMPPATIEVRIRQPQRREL